MVGRKVVRGGRRGRVEGHRRDCGLEEEKVVVVMVWPISSRVAGCRYRGGLQIRIVGQPAPPAGRLAVGLVAWPADWLHLVGACSHVRCDFTTWAAQGGSRQLRWCLLMVVSLRNGPKKIRL